MDQPIDTYATILSTFNVTSENGKCVAVPLLERFHKCHEFNGLNCKEFPPIFLDHYSSWRCFFYIGFVDHIDESFPSNEATEMFLNHSGGLTFAFEEVPVLNLAHSHALAAHGIVLETWVGVIL